jgi:hypothetical protein
MLLLQCYIDQDIPVRVHGRLLRPGADIPVAPIGLRKAQRVLTVLRKRLICLGGVDTWRLWAADR